MGITFIASSTDSRNGTAAFTLPVPTGTEAGHIMVAAAASTENLDDGPLAAAGWTLVEKTSSWGSRWTQIYWKLASASEPSTYTFRAIDTTPHHEIGGIMTFAGVNQTTPIDGQSKVTYASTTTSVVIPSITTTAAGCMLAACSGGWAQTSGYWTVPGSMTEEWDGQSDTGSSRVNSVGAYELLGAAGASGTRTFTPSATTHAGGVMVALKPGGRWWLGVAGWGG
jgi:MSHA biogenesis protein MshQ